MKKILFALAASAALTVASGALAADKYKACFIYVGSKTDGGWTQAHDIGRQMVDKELGDQVETAYVENVPEGPDAERALERFARSGCGIIFTTSFGFMDQTLAVAEKFPDVKFEHATGYKTAPNVTTYNSRFYEGRYIIGQIAGKMSKTGTAGYIASFPIPEVVMGINAFLLGARSVNPDFKLKVVWVNSWFDAGKEADAAQHLVDELGRLAGARRTHMRVVGGKVAKHLVRIGDVGLLTAGHERELAGQRFRRAARERAVDPAQAIGPGHLRQHPRRGRVDRRHVDDQRAALRGLGNAAVAEHHGFDGLGAVERGDDVVAG
ncbi:MAG: BMP family ABC transporter substrate-binding protein, partial [Nitratireductor sp.]|nr:BMP family ABC transporter substrate-binding protein [Nitratireductor sp.]